MAQFEVHNMLMYREDFINSDLYKLFPAINVNYVKDIPCDYPGVMGVPITFLDKYDKEQFEIIGIIKPIIEEKRLYRRILIRNKKPDIPEVFNLTWLLELYGSQFELLKTIGGEHNA